MNGLILALLPVPLTAIGTWLLVREVSKAHRFEALDRDMTVLKAMLDSYNASPREFWISSAMDNFGWTREQAERAGELLSDADIRAAVAQTKAMLEAPEALKRWREHTTPAQLRWRHRSLWTGFAFLMIASLVQAIVIVSNYLVGTGS